MDVFGLIWCNAHICIRNYLKQVIGRLHIQNNLQEQQSEASDEIKVTFEEDDTFWEPADDVNELYKQLYSKKYREIVRQQVE